MDEHLYVTGHRIWSPRGRMKTSYRHKTFRIPSAAGFSASWAAVAPTFIMSNPANRSGPSSHMLHSTRRLWTQGKSLNTAVWSSCASLGPVHTCTKSLYNCGSYSVCSPFWFMPLGTLTSVRHHPTPLFGPKLMPLEEALHTPPHYRTHLTTATGSIGKNRSTTRSLSLIHI